MKNVYIFICLFCSCQICWSYLSSCGNSYFQSQKDTIIRTVDSVANGAAELKTFHAFSERHCERVCCKHSACTVAVFETTTKNLCYLFNCGKDGSLCNFEPDTKYTVSIKKTVLKDNTQPKQRNQVALVRSKYKNKESQQTNPDNSDRKLEMEEEAASEEASNSGGHSPSRWNILDPDSSSDDKGHDADRIEVPTSETYSPSTSTGLAALSFQSTTASGVGASPTLSMAELYRRTRAAAIGLGVALALTVLAIAALGCRLRQLLERRRRLVGKLPLRRKEDDDEDYLINGMYL